MALSIKNAEAERLAREVAQATGESITQAIEISLRERLQRLQKQDLSGLTLQRLEEILVRVDALEPLDDRNEADIFGYAKDR